MPPTRRTLLKALGLTATLLMAGCSLWPDKWHSKLTVTVMTPHGEVSGSAVRAHEFSNDPVLGNGHYQDKGEATVVDLGGRKYLFALIQEWKPHDYSVFYGNHLKGDETLAGQVGRKADITNTGQAPMLVTFKNLIDPTSVVEVNPSDLAATFSSGYALKSITLEITDEPVIEGVVEKLLPWALTLKGRIKPIGNPIPTDHVNKAIDDVYRDAFVRKDPL